MATEAALAVAAVLVVALTDTLLALRVLRAYRKSGRAAHLAIVAGISASFFAVVGISLVLAALGEPELAGTGLFVVARWLSFEGAAASYGLVGVFAALAFGERPQRVGAVLAAIALLALAATGVETEPLAPTLATTRWALRVPFVLLAVAGSGYGAFAARRLARLYATARAAGRDVDRVALARMRLIGRGFAAMTASQLALLGFTPGDSFDTPSGLAMVAVILLGALVFVLACVATWATPAWMRARWGRS